MENRKIKVLHIIKDDKFYDCVINAFESDERFENRSVLFVNSSEYEFFLIKQTEKVELLWTKKMLKECLQSSDYDVIFFHSLSVEKYWYFHFIPNNKIVIWWGWGFDLYSSEYGMNPLIPIDLYKPETKQLMDSIKQSGLKRKLKGCIRDIFWRPYYESLRRKVIARIDYFQPVIPFEYQLMKEVDGFQAKEFYYPRCFTSYYAETGCIKNENGGILIGNSATYTNNHLDVWTDIRKYVPSYRNIIIPVNYGVQRYADHLSKEIKSKSHHIHIIREFMPRDEYFKLIDGCSYAVFGVLRQQAMGNIYHCLYQGVKVFLYRDSLVYRFLKEWGYVVFAIEDIDEFSFSTPLSLNELEKNAKAFEHQRNYVANVRENANNEILNRITN